MGAKRPIRLFTNKNRKVLIVSKKIFIYENITGENILKPTKIEVVWIFPPHSKNMLKIEIKGKENLHIYCLQ